MGPSKYPNVIEYQRLNIEARTPTNNNTARTQVSRRRVVDLLDKMSDSQRMELEKDRKARKNREKKREEDKKRRKQKDTLRRRLRHI